MNQNGYIKLYRKLLDWEWFDNSYMVHLWICLVSCANTKAKRWHGEMVERGQCLVSVSKLHEMTNISNCTIRRCLKRLQETGEIIVKTTNKNSLITICKYDTYQGAFCSNEQTDEQTSEQSTEQTGEQADEQANEQTNEQADEQSNDYQMTIKRFSNEQLLKNNKNNKNNKNIKENPLSNDKGQKKSYSQLRTVEQKREFEHNFLIEHNVEEGSELWTAITEWLEYKRDRKQPYRSERSLKALLTEIHNLSQGNTSTAIAIINRSMANNYQGLFASTNARQKDNGDNYTALQDPRLVEHSGDTSENFFSKYQTT